MNKKHHEVYSITGFKDLLHSPVFYSVAAVSIILGAASIFGFLQNPYKLKTVVDVISQKVSFSEPVGSSRRGVALHRNSMEMASKQNATREGDLSAQNEARFTRNSRNKITRTNYQLIHRIASTQRSNDLLLYTLDDVSFDYDITSKQFWSKLESGNIISPEEETSRDEIDDILFGAPLSSEYSEDVDYKYSINTVSYPRL